MDRLAILQDALDRTSAALDRYRDPHPGILEVRAVDVQTSGTPGERGCTAGALQRILLDIADRHEAACDLEVCPTCDSIAEALSVSLSALRWLHQDELEDRVRR